MYHVSINWFGKKFDARDSKLSVAVDTSVRNAMLYWRKVMVRSDAYLEEQAPLMLGYDDAGEDAAYTLKEFAAAADMGVRLCFRMMKDNNVDTMQQASSYHMVRKLHAEGYDLHSLVWLADAYQMEYHPADKTWGFCRWHDWAVWNERFGGLINAIVLNHTARLLDDLADPGLIVELDA